MRVQGIKLKVLRLEEECVHLLSHSVLPNSCFSPGNNSSSLADGLRISLSSPQLSTWSDNCLLSSLSCIHFALFYLLLLLTFCSVLAVFSHCSLNWPEQWLQQFAVIVWHSLKQEEAPSYCSTRATFKHYVCLNTVAKFHLSKACLG